VPLKASELLCPKMPLMVKAGLHSFTVEAMPDKWPGILSFMQRDALTYCVCHCLTSWRVMEGETPLPVTRATVNRLPEGVRAAIAREIARAYHNPAAHAGEEETEMSVEINDLINNYRDTATVSVSMQTAEGVVRETLTLTHRPVDENLWAEVTAIKAEGITPAAALQLTHLDARVEDLTDKGKPVEEFTAEFWASLKPGLRARIVAGVLRNVPREVALTRPEAMEGDSDAVNDEE
jgi:hypothetical protein